MNGRTFSTAAAPGKQEAPQLMQAWLGLYPLWCRITAAAASGERRTSSVPDLLAELRRAVDHQLLGMGPWPRWQETADYVEAARDELTSLLEELLMLLDEAVWLTREQANTAPPPSATRPKRR